MHYTNENFGGNVCLDRIMQIIIIKKAKYFNAPENRLRLDFWMNCEQDVFS